MLGEVEFNIGQYGGKMRQQITYPLTGGVLKNSKINLQITVLPEADYKTQGISLVPAAVNKQATIKKIEEPVPVKRDSDKIIPTQRTSEKRASGKRLSTKVSSIDLTEESKGEPAAKEETVVQEPIQVVVDPMEENVRLEAEFAELQRRLTELTTEHGRLEA